MSHRKFFEAASNIHLHFLDFVIFFVFIAIAFFSILKIQKAESQKSFLVVTTQDGEYIYPLEKDRVLSFNGMLGNTIIEISGGKAFFKNSPCPNHLCMRMKAVKNNNDWAACIPNGVFMHVEGAKDSDLDLTVN